MSYSYGGLTQSEYESMQAEELAQKEQNALAQKKVIEEWFWDYCPVYGVARYQIPGLGILDAYEISELGWTYWENFQPKSIAAQPLKPDRECTCGSGYDWVVCPEGSQYCG